MEDKRPTRRRWFRFSLRTMLALVTLVAVACFFVRWMSLRSAEFSERSREHFRRLPDTGLAWGFAPDYFDHHDAMGHKYERAAQYPWLPVEPDPPEPQP